jgi:D-galactarolactone cycloisomerase
MTGRQSPLPPTPPPLLKRVLAIWGSGIATAAGLHVLATLPPSPHTANPIPPYNEPLLAWDSTLNPLRTDLLTEPFALEEGTIRVPTGPGLGVAVNDDTLRHYLTAHWVVE